MAKAYSYIRFSSLEQAKGRSYHRQREACVKYCEEHGLELADGEEYSFFDRGLSAYTGANLDDGANLNRFIKLVEDGTIAEGSTLIVESLDRLQRQDVWEALPVFMALINSGIRVVTLTDKHVYAKGGGTTDLILSLFILSRAHEESSTKAERIGDAWSKKRELARTAGVPIGAAVPLWLRLVRADVPDAQQAIQQGRYVLDIERANVVQRIFQLAVDGYGKGATARILNAEGTRSFKGTTWGPSSIDKVLKNKAVLGFYQPTRKGSPDGDAIPGYFPAVVSESLFYQAQEALRTRRVAKATRQTDDFQIWQGIARCNLCNGPMHLVNKGKPPKGNRYLRCGNIGKGRCTAKSVRYEQTEQVFKRVLSKLNALPLIRESAGKLEKELGEVKSRLAEQRRVLDDHIEAAKQFGQSKSIYKLIDEAEQAINVLASRQDLLEQELATDRIVDAQEFEAKVDLVSYEGRARANALLKRLRIVVLVTGGPETEFFVIRGLREGADLLPKSWKKYTAHLRENLLLHILLRNGESAIFPLSEEQRQTYILQEKDGEDAAKYRRWHAEQAPLRLLRRVRA